ncbi:MAG: DUF2007 domain-containing protein [Bacteroidales bacterium]|nr:DUF2007 domain-containing protein [Bacteroidales bacterium]
MDNWITIISFTYPHEAHMAKAKLESEGIETIIQDELTAQVNNFYSNAIGGVKLLVKESDARRANEILKESKVIIHDKDNETESEEETNKKLLTAKFIYLIAIILVIVAIVIIPIAISSIPTTQEKLTFYNWCFNGMYYEDYEFTPSTLHSEGVYIEFTDDCWESIKFQPDGIILLPGFESDKIRAFWKIENKKLTIWPMNGDLSLVNSNKEEIIAGEQPTENMYYGIYSVKFESIHLILESEKQIIYAYR